ncbi:MAG: UDP-N-acetylglucosamine 2-epimerase (non-hydrolyzing) [Alphaproteobacteria bacterium]|nr:UDP-N-acetylglucosamine 2-epimerase (non-hydrolyzing) [Alphaproteobacteria bacterium]
MTVVGTRPEIIRLSRVIAVLDRHCRHTLVHTGQNYDYELNQIFFDDLGLRRPDIFLNAAGKSSAETIAHVLEQMDKTLAETTPDAVLVLGDTNSCFAVLAAKRRKIPTFHMEAGNRCFDERVPEEINRRIIDHTADINMPYSAIARDYLVREGLAPERIIKTGSPMAEVLNFYRDKIAASTILDTLGLVQEHYFTVSAHREENVEPEARLATLVRVLNRIAEEFGEPVVVSVHPRTRKRIDEAGAHFHKGVKLMKPLGFTDYVCLQQKARAVLSDSGTITEEASILNFPALNMRDIHERPEGTEEASVILTGFNEERIMQALSVVSAQPRGDDRLLREVADYAVPNVSEKVLRILLSYKDVVERTVWKRFP